MNNKPLSKEDVENMMYSEYGEEVSQQTFLAFQNEVVEFLKWYGIKHVAPEMLYQKFLETREKEK